jgi:hypothetical protein
MSAPNFQQGGRNKPKIQPALPTFANALFSVLITSPIPPIILSSNAAASKIEFANDVD